MAKLKIVKLGDEILRQKCRRVEAVTPRILRLLDDMVETMRFANGCGLAGPQVGILRRVCVVEVDGKVYQMINPEIVYTEGEQCEAEGCLSVPSQWGTVKRPAFVRVKYYDRNGKECFAEGTDLLARAFCHEIDHLDGTLFIDKVVDMLEADE